MLRKSRHCGLVGIELQEAEVDLSILLLTSIWTYREDRRDCDRLAWVVAGTLQCFIDIGTELDCRLFRWLIQLANSHRPLWLFLIMLFVVSSTTRTARICRLSDQRCVAEIISSLYDWCPSKNMFLTSEHFAFPPNDNRLPCSDLHNWKH